MTPPEIRVLAPAELPRRRLLQLVAGLGGAAAASPARAETASLNLFTYPTYAAEPLIALGGQQGFTAGRGCSTWSCPSTTTSISRPRPG